MTPSPTPCPQENENQQLFPTFLDLLNSPFLNDHHHRIPQSDFNECSNNSSSCCSSNDTVEVKGFVRLSIRTSSATKLHFQDKKLGSPVQTFWQFFAPSTPIKWELEDFSEADTDSEGGQDECSTHWLDSEELTASSSSKPSPPPKKPVRRDGAWRERRREEKQRQNAGISTITARPRRLLFSRSLSPILQINSPPYQRQKLR